jgi:hypothetical protein
MRKKPIRPMNGSAAIAREISGLAAIVSGWSNPVVTTVTNT